MESLAEAEQIQFNALLQHDHHPHHRIPRCKASGAQADPEQAVELMDVGGAEHVPESGGDDEDLLDFPERAPDGVLRGHPDGGRTSQSDHSFSAVTRHRTPDRLC